MAEVHREFPDETGLEDLRRVIRVRGMVDRDPGTRLTFTANELLEHLDRLQREREVADARENDSDSDSGS
jgi:hypothetical protein